MHSFAGRHPDGRELSVVKSGESPEFDMIFAFSTAAGVTTTPTRIPFSIGGDRLFATENELANQVGGLS